MTYLSLHSASQFLLLAATLAAFSIVLRTWRMLRKKRTSLPERSVQTASALGEKPVSRRIRTTLVDNFPLILLIITGASVTGTLWQIHSYYSAPVFEYHDVRFISPTDSTGYSWWMEKSDGPFRADFCRDYDVPSLHAQPGEVLSKLRYKDMGCWSIKDKDLGFWFYRDKSHWTIPTDVSQDLQTALKEIKAHE